MDDDIMKLDLYEIIGATITADESELKKAYRKKALACHPDKNPDNPKAAELFLQLTKALEILTDTTARAAYDKVVKRKIQIEVEKKATNVKRRKLIDDLEAREEAYKNSQTASYTSMTDEQKLKAEIDRLRKEGSRIVEEENEILRQRILKELSSLKESSTSNNMYGMNGCRVKIKWKAAADDDTNGGYNYENLHRFLSKYGDISVLVVSATKKGRALVEYENHEAALSAVNYECGLVTNRIKLQGMWQDPKSAQASQSKYSALFSGGSLFPSAEGASNAGRHQAPEGLGTLFTGGSLFPSAGGTSNARRHQVPQGLSCSTAPDIFNRQPQNFTNFESAVLNNLKREEERKKLIEQMKAEDEGT